MKREMDVTAENRSNTYGFLSTVYLQEPSREFIKSLRESNILDVLNKSDLRLNEQITNDVSDKFLNKIKNKKEELKLTDKQLESRKVPYDSPQIKTDEADAVIIVNTYHHIEDRPEYFSKVLTGLKKDAACPFP